MLEVDGLLGRVVVIDVWATWCAPCREWLPELQALADDYVPRGVEVLTLHADPDARGARVFMNRIGVTLPVLLETPDGAARRAWGYDEIPTTIVLDRVGRVVFEHAGYDGSVSSELRAELDVLLATDASADRAHGSNAPSSWSGRWSTGCSNSSRQACKNSRDASV